LFNEHLFLTNTVGCSFLMSLGDCAQQKIERVYDKKRSPEKNRSHDWFRTGRMFTMGFVLGPMAHFWYSWLDRRIPIKSGKAVIKKILYDQSIASPLFSFTFITGMNKLEGNSLRHGVDEFLEKFPIIYAVDWCVWPPTQAINFWVLPTRFRVMYVYMVDFVWYTFNSYIKHKKSHDSRKISKKDLAENFEKDLAEIDEKIRSRVR